MVDDYVGTFLYRQRIEPAELVLILSGFIVADTDANVADYHIVRVIDAYIMLSQSNALARSRLACNRDIRFAYFQTVLKLDISANIKDNRTRPRRGIYSVSQRILSADYLRHP